MIQSGILHRTLGTRPSALAWVPDHPPFNPDSLEEIRSLRDCTLQTTVSVPNVGNQVNAHII